VLALGASKWPKKLTEQDLRASVPLPISLAHGPADSFTFAVYGDNRLSRSRKDLAHDSERRNSRREVVAAICAESPDFVIHTGDLVERGRDPERWKAFWEDTASLLRTRFFYPVAGNHEYKGGFSGAYFDLFHESIGTARSYAFRVGTSYFIFFDSAAKPHPGGKDSLNIHATWFRERLEEAGDCTYLFVVFHHPAFSTGRGRVRRFLTARHAGHAPRSEERNLRGILAGELARRRERIPGARTVTFSGHSHFYEHYVHRGVDFVVTGGGGAPAHRPSRDGGPERIAAYQGDHFVLVTVVGERLELSFKPVGRGKWIQRVNGE
jgi:3',5'-cyclic AMP phosphodiesterase CpdA